MDDDLNYPLEDLRQRRTKQYLTYGLAFGIRAGIYCLIWYFFAHRYFSQRIGGKISVIIFIFLCFLSFARNRVWKIFTDTDFSGVITDIRITDTPVDIAPSLRVNLKRIAYKTNYIISVKTDREKRKKIKLEYTDQAHIMPYKTGDRIKYYAGTNYPQFDCPEGDDTEKRAVCVWCGMPVLRKDAEDEKCHFCHEDIIP